VARLVHKVIEKEGHRITIYGSNRRFQLYWATPEWVKDKSGNSQEAYFNYGGSRYYLSTFEKTPEGTFLEGFDGYHNETSFSGVCIKWLKNDRGDIDTEYVKAFTFCS
jgi:predicted transcriptional regulator